MPLSLILTIFSCLSLSRAGVVWELKMPETKDEVSNWLSMNSFVINNDSFTNWQIDNRYLYMESIDDSYEIGIKFDRPINPLEARYISFTYKVIETPKGADLRVSDLEDSAFRIYVAFGKKLRQKLILNIPNTIVYSHGTGNKVGDKFLSSRFKNIYFHIVGQGIKDSWIKVKRNLYSDYEKSFKGEKMPSIIGLLIKIDSNNSSQTSRAFLKSLRITTH